MTVDKAIFTEKFICTMNFNSLSEFATEALAGRFHALTERMLTVNEHMNLTAITDIDGVILKHYVDSLTASKYIPKSASLVDVGCGAGFPSLPLAIARPDLRITALDSTAKRINYIKETAEMLGITGISVVAARAEELAHNAEYRGQFDVACARAVARLNVLCELCMPYVKNGGSFVAMKANSAEEVAEAGFAIKKMGGRIAVCDSFALVSHDGSGDDPRSVIVIEKISETPENYPRNNSQIKKKPL